MFQSYKESPTFRAIAILAILTFGLLPGRHADAVGAGVRPPICHTSYDPYKVSASVLKACGNHVFPLEKVVRLRDGGKEYVYTVEGAR